MKKLFLILVLAVFALGANAQDFTLSKVAAPTQIITADGITNTESNDTTILLKIPQKSPWHVCVFIEAANTSGTTDIDVTYAGSMDNSTFQTISSDSLATGNLTYLFEDALFPYRYLKITWTGVGTQVSVIDAWIYLLEQAE